ncbi:MAG TPA: Uma2 family endonuclease [Isosphaeraceae bacterium]|jgi:Uma2 family endonuclease|nr:Uma2 family endonuclease [Isosphaeraceae bacterium]
MAIGLQELETQPPALMDSDAAQFYEVVDGKIVENPPMGARQSILASYLLLRIGQIASSNRLGWAVNETLFLIDPARKLKRRPDVAFVSAKRWSLKQEVPDTETWDVVPDLTVEVVSESNSANAVARKIEEYFQAGVQKVWVIYPSTSKIYVYDSPTRVRILQLGDELEGEAIIPGFHVPLSTLFKLNEANEASNQTE